MVIPDGNINASLRNSLRESAESPDLPSTGLLCPPLSLRSAVAEVAIFSVSTLHLTRDKTFKALLLALGVVSPWLAGIAAGRLRKAETCLPSIDFIPPAA